MATKGSEVREYILNNGVKLWQVADVLQIAPQTLSIKLRHDWTDEQVEEIRQAVAQVKAESK